MTFPAVDHDKCGKEEPVQVVESTTTTSTSSVWLSNNQKKELKMPKTTTSTTTKKTKKIITTSSTTTTTSEKELEQPDGQVAEVQDLVEQPIKPHVQAEEVLDRVEEMAE